MAFGRAWQHAKYACGVWEAFAHQANSTPKTFVFGLKIEKCKRLFQMFGFGTHRFEHMFFDFQNAG
jgi:hypothetical protein